MNGTSRENANKGGVSRKTLIILAIALVVVFALLFFCPDVPAAVSRALFENSFRPGAFVFAVTVFAAECAYLSFLKKRGGIAEKAVFAIVIVSAVAGGILLLSNDRSEDEFGTTIYSYIESNDTVCLEDQYERFANEEPERYEAVYDRLRTYHDTRNQIRVGSSNIESVSGFMHFVIVMVLFAMGWMLCTLVFRGEKDVLAAFMAFPAGAAIACAAGIVFIIIGIPFRMMTILGVFIVLFGLLVALMQKKKPAVDKSRAAAAFLFMAVAALIIIWARTGRLTPPDSVEKTMNGVLLAEADLSRSEILSFISFGFIEPIIHCIAWKFGVDYLYSFYALMPLCSLGIMASALFALSENAKKPLLIILAALGVGFTASNNDFIACAMWVLSNGAMGTYVIILITCLILCFRREDYRVGWLTALASAAFITTRVEGSCFVILFLVLALGIAAFRERCLPIAVVAGMEILIWSIYNLMFNRTNDEFWSPGKTMLLIVCGVALIAATLLVRLKIKPIRWLLRHYYAAASVVLAALSVFCVVYKGHYGIRTFQIFVKHFSASDLCNSAGICSCFLLLAPLLIYSRKKEAAFSLVTVAGYLLIAMDILTFRVKGDMIHVQMGDSGRRMIQQIFPAAMLLAAYCVAEMPLCQAGCDMISDRTGNNTEE